MDLMLIPKTLELDRLKDFMYMWVCRDGDG
jgi:hypothetical protein